MTRLAASRPKLAVVSVNAALIAAAIFALGPLVWMASASLMHAGEMNRAPPPLWPASATLEHYRALFGQGEIGRKALNSLGIALVTTALSTLVDVMAGYAFAKLRFAGRDGAFRALLAALVVPAQVAMLPLFLMLKSMGLVNTYAGVVLPGLAGVFGIFLVRQYALSLPDELLEAARIDGAGEWRIFMTIVLPLLKPILVTLAMFQFLAAWNDFMWPLIVLSDGERQTLPVALASLSREHVQDGELMMAGAMVTILPALALFVLLQRHYLAGLTAGIGK